MIARPLDRRGGRLGLGLVALCALFALSGCPHGPLSTGGGFPVAAERAYLQTHGDWTRELRLTRTWETHLLLRATLVSEPMLRAQAAYVSEARLDTPAEADQRREAMFAELNGQLVIVFSAYTPWPDAQEFGAGLDAPWRVRAYADGAPLAPLEVTRVDRISAEQAMLYPVHTVWSELWIARFEAPARADEIAFQIAGPRGRGEVSWALE